MRLLLDTHILLWAATRQARLPKATAVAICDLQTELLFRVVSIWKCAIKSRCTVQTLLTADPVVARYPGPITPV